jgi:anthranilate phosphoribosyltransferase
VFNVLGPLTNPAGAKRQVIGVFSPELVDKLAHVLASLGTEHALVVHGSDGLDELTVTGETKIAEVRNGKVERVFTLTPEEVGLSRHAIEDLRGGDAQVNGAILKQVLAGKQGAERDIVVLNAGATLYVAGHADSIESGVRLAEESIDSGNALSVLNKLVAVTQRLTQLKELA